MAMIQITFTPESAEEAAIIGEAMSRIMAISAQQMSVAPAETKEPVAEAPKRTRATKATAAPVASVAEAQPESSAVSGAEAAETFATGAAQTGGSSTAETEDPKPVAEPSTQEAPAAQTASSQEPSVSLEEVRAKLAELSQAGKQQQVVALIASMGARKLTEIPAEKYAKLLAQAAAL